MRIALEVAPLGEERETSFYDLHLFHAGCGSGELRKHRQFSTNSCMLRCDCGLVVEIFDSGHAMREIMAAAIDQQTRVLPPNSYNAVGDAVITVSSRAT